MRHVCAWCKCETAPPDGTADDDIITHSICQKCKKLVMAEAEEPEIQALLHSIEIGNQIKHADAYDDLF